MFNLNNTPNHVLQSSDNPFSNNYENPSKNYFVLHIQLICLLDDLLNDNTNMSTVSLSSMIRYLTLIFLKYLFFFFLATIINEALQSNASRLRPDWLDNLCLLISFIRNIYSAFLLFIPDV